MAVVQSEWVIAALRAADNTLETELITMKTTGDMILDRPLDRIGGKGLFVKELDIALLDERVDLTVHSLKDMPMEQDARLPIAAYSKRADPRDVLILPLGQTSLDPEKPIGCSSKRRTLQLQKLYPQMRVEGVRGNLQTRLAKLDSGQYAALVLAHAGISRLGLEERISRVFSAEEIIPAAGQGILAVQCRAGELQPLLAAVDDSEARCCALAERAFVRTLDGGCSSPVAAYAHLSGATLHLTGLCDDPAAPFGYRTDSIVGEGDQAELLGLRLAARMKGKIGKVWLVGAGPSDAGLMTLKGKALLEQADVVVYDALVGAGIMGMIGQNARRINVGKHAGSHPVPQEQINRILLWESLAGNKVVRLKGGDPFLFGRGGEELELLCEHDVPFEVVPGVTSAIAVPAYAGIPVTHRDYCSSVHIITGHTKNRTEAQIDYSALVRLSGTLVFLMGVGALPVICKELVAAGMPETTPAAVLEQGTTARQRRIAGTVATLPALAEQQQAKTPAIIVVGEVCGLADRFDWVGHRPLAGRRMVVTRPRASTGTLCALLREQGAEVIELPSIETRPICPNHALEQAIAQISDYGWLVFTSPAGVDVFFTHLRQGKRDVRALGEIRLAAIGAATAKAIEHHGLICALMPDEYNAAALGELLAKQAGGERVLIARAKEGAPELPERLRQAEIAFDDLPLYETIYTQADADGVQELVQTGGIDDLLFTSASTVHGFVKTVGDGLDYSKIRAVCIGASTARAAEQYGMPVLVARQATIAAMVEILLEQQEGGKPNG